MVKNWSKLGKNDERIVVLEADLGKSTMSILFGNEYPDRYFQMGIAEQNMASVAAGLALTGKIAFINSFAVFTSGRAYDQIRSSICIPQNSTSRYAALLQDLSDYGDGKTHQSVDDIAIMRVLPHMTVLAPADAVETAANGGGNGTPGMGHAIFGLTETTCLFILIRTRSII